MSDFGMVRDQLLVFKPNRFPKLAIFFVMTSIPANQLSLP